MVPSSSTNPSLRVKIPAAGEGKLTINVKSPTSEMYTEVKEADRVRDLEKLIKKAWGDNNDNDNDDYIALYYKSIQLKSDQLLSSYNLRDGSVVTVSVLTEPPTHRHRHRQSNSKFQQETNCHSNGGNGCGNIMFHMANMFSQFCTSIFSGH